MISSSQVQFNGACHTTTIPKKITTLLNIKKGTLLLWKVNKKHKSNSIELIPYS